MGEAAEITIPEVVAEEDDDVGAAAVAQKERKRERERGRSRRSGFIGDPDGFRFRGYVEREERTGADGGRVSSIHARAQRARSILAEVRAQV